MESIFFQLIWVIVGIAFFFLTFLKDKPSTKKTFKIISAIFIFTLPFTMNSWVGAFNTALLYSVMAIGLNILLGNAGQISLGHAAFYAIGAFIASFLTVMSGLPIIIAIILAGIFTSIIGFIMGTPVLRLKGHFLGIATLGLHVVIENLVKDKLKHYFPGAGVPDKFKIGSLVDNLQYSFKNSLGNLDYSSEILGEAKPFYYNFMQRVTDSVPDIAVFFVTLVFLILSVYMARNILRTKIGRALGALRDSEIAARTLGVNIPLYKNIAFSLSAFFAGIAGGIFALSIGTLDEASFNIGISLYVLAMIILGGVGTIQGSIIGASLYQLLNMKIIQEILGKKYQSLSPAILGLGVVLMIIFAPKGIVYMLYQLKLKLSRKRS